MSNSQIVPHAIGPLLVPPADLKNLVEKVLETCDVKESTRTSYRYGLVDFLGWNREGLLDPNVVVRYKAYLRNRTDLATGTKNLYLAGVRIVLRKLFESGVLPRDFGQGVKNFSVSRGLKRSPITDEEVQRVFAALRGMDDPRLLVVFTLLYLQGMRQNEVLLVRAEDFNADAMTLAILGKGRDERELIDLHPGTVKVLGTYLQDLHLKSGYLFASPKKRDCPLTRQQLHNMIRGVHQQCGITNVGHGWRKVFVSKLIDGGMDLLTVSSFSRHRSIEMLKVYYDRLDRKKKLPQYYEVFAEVSTTN